MSRRYPNNDIALARVLDNYTDLEIIRLFYDVICMYKKRLLDRILAFRPDLAEVIKRLTYLIGKFHHGAHIEHCQFENSASFESGVGRTDGEEVERLWAEMNQASGSVKQMTAGNRHDTLNDMFLDNNWRKNEGRGTWFT